MIGRWIRKAALYGTEALVAIVLVLVFFLACMMILGLGFPKGTGLRELMGGSSWSGGGSTTPRVQLDRNGTPRAAGPRTVARLAVVHQKVKDKKSDRIDWSDARAGAPLAERDAVQTFALSSAVIAFEGQIEAVLRQNSLIVIGTAASDEEAKRGDISLLVTNGAVRATAGGNGETGGDLRLITANAEARVGATAPSTDLQVSVSPDRSSTIAVYRGATAITAAGRTVTIGARQAVTVTPAGVLGEPVSLPDVPDVDSPGQDALFAYRTVPPLVALAWRPVPGASRYHVQLARDAGFNDVIDDDQVATTRLDQGNLPPGSYFWRVSAMKGDVEGESSAPRRLTVVEDRVPPFLRVSFPEGQAQEATVVVSGEAEPGAEVFVGSARVATDAAGRFSREVELAPGWNVVVVEAIDAAGNVAYQSERLMAGAPSRARLQ